MNDPFSPSDLLWIFFGLIAFFLITFIVVSAAGEILRQKYNRENQDRDRKR